jgi:hypothetical protein
MDVMFGSDGNAQVLELNDRPSMIRRIIDDNQGQNIDLIEEEVRLAFGMDVENGKWEELYSRPGLTEAIGLIRCQLENAGLFVDDETTAPTSAP